MYIDFCLHFQISRIYEPVRMLMTVIFGKELSRPFLKDFRFVTKNRSMVFRYMIPPLQIVWPDIEVSSFVIVHSSKTKVNAKNMGKFV